MSLSSVNTPCLTPLPSAAEVAFVQGCIRQRVGVGRCAGAHTGRTELSYRNLLSLEHGRVDGVVVVQRRCAGFC